MLGATFTFRTCWVLPYDGGCYLTMVGATLERTGCYLMTMGKARYKGLFTKISNGLKSSVANEKLFSLVSRWYRV